MAEGCQNSVLSQRAERHAGKFSISRTSDVNKVVESEFNRVRIDIGKLGDVLADNPAPAQLNAVMNWFEELKRRVPVK